MHRKRPRSHGRGYDRPHARRKAAPSFGNEQEEVRELERRVKEEAPPPGTQPFIEGDGGKGQKKKQPMFKDLPVSERTLAGLEAGGFTDMTDIQLAALPHALAGRDVLGAARTGSGKTLAFVVPLLEALYRQRWALSDGLGAIIISPTRELALQIFQVLKVAGKYQALSAGVITGGGRDYQGEQLRVVSMNVLIATPGRLLQHLEQTPNFDPSQLQMLVLDEADRCLDMGFKDQLNSILTYLPPDRQTLLFSATQTRSVKDLARLSLNKGLVEYVAVGRGEGEGQEAATAAVAVAAAAGGGEGGEEGKQEEDEAPTPKRLVQHYVICKLEQKLNVVFSFFKSHLSSRILVFMSSCAQVRFAYELMCGLQPGLPLLALHGKLKQERRTDTYMDFLRRPAAALFATDIAARGLDFPGVDWVLQVDAPESSATYVHRVGRTARYKSGGRALMLLLPSEEKGMLESLKTASIPVKRLTINPDKMKQAGAATKRAAAFVAADPDRKRLADKAFHSYVRSVQLQPDRSIFDATALPLEEFAASLGLASAPKMKGLTSAAGRGQGGGAASVEEMREECRAKKNVNRSLQRLKEQIKLEKLAKRLAKAGKETEAAAVLAGGKAGREAVAAAAAAATAAAKKGQQPLPAEARAGFGDDSDGDDDGEAGLLVVKKRGTSDRVSSKAEVRAEAEEMAEAAAETDKKRKRKHRITRDGVAVDATHAGGTKTVFTEDGEVNEEQRAPLRDYAHSLREGASTEEKAAPPSKEALSRANAEHVARVALRLKAMEGEDKEAERQRVRELHLNRKIKANKARDEGGGGGGGMEVTLGGSSDDEEEESDSGSDESGESASGSDSGSGSGDSEGGGGSEDESEEEGGRKRKSAASAKTKGKGKGKKKLSVAEQEEVVLSMLRG